jgi:hypothetical protein
MDRHGTGAPFNWQRTGRRAGPATKGAPREQEGLEAIARTLRMRGFRHFLKEPTPEQRFRIYDGLLPHASEESLCKLRLLMGHLANRMRDEYKWPAHSTAGLQPWENPHIPSGYTYFLQLVAHDLVHTSVPISFVEDTTTGALNTRRSRLRLDSIYGGGPLVCPFVYELDDTFDRTRTRLRLGRIQKDPQDSDMGCPFRDIPRIRPDRVSGETRDLTTSAGVQPGLTDVLIADSRNDANVILSQMVTVFHHLHNGILDLLPGRDAMVHAASVWEAAHERYLCARSAVTLIYRNVIRKDLMKRILHPKVYQAYQDPKFVFLDRQSRGASGARSGPLAQEGWGIPLEFSHGAFRFGHAMIRPRYQINERNRDSFSLDLVVGRTSASEPQSMPLDRSWIVQWSKFFEVGDSRPNLSRRIGPQFSGPLTTPDVLPPIVQQGGDSQCEREQEIEANSMGLAYRDLMSSALVNMWSVAALIEEIKRIKPEFIALSRLLSDSTYRAERLRGWLASKDEDQYNRLQDLADVASIAQDPPLPFFILFEAADDPECGGMRLGVLGSILVAEVVLGALSRDPLPPEKGAKNLKQALATISGSIYGGTNHLAAIPEIETMSQLIEFTAKQAELRNATPAFL